MSFQNELPGKTIARINWANESEGEIESILFTDGSSLDLFGSSQIGEEAVWCALSWPAADLVDRAIAKT